MDFIVPTTDRVDIDMAIAITRFLAVHLRLVRRPLPSSCHRGRAIPRPRAAPITLYLPLHHPSPLCSWSISAVVPCLTIKEPLASTDESGHSSCPSQDSRPDGCPVDSPLATAFHVLASLIAASPFVPLVHPADCRISSLLMPPPPICRRIRLSSRRRLLSRPSRASRPAG